MLRTNYSYFGLIIPVSNLGIVILSSIKTCCFFNELYSVSCFCVQTQTIGSLIKINKQEFENIEVEENSIFTDEQRHLKTQAFYLSQQYDLVVTNPPYLNSSYTEGELKQYVEKEFNSTKSDLFACFLIHASSLTKQNRFIGFISPYVWMLLVELWSLQLRDTCKPSWTLFTVSSMVSCKLSNLLLQL